MVDYSMDLSYFGIIPVIDTPNLIYNGQSAFT